jgi:hypothetical protein
MTNLVIVFWMGAGVRAADLTGRTSSNFNVRDFDFGKAGRLR